MHYHSNMSPSERVHAFIRKCKIPKDIAGERRKKLLAVLREYLWENFTVYLYYSAPRMTKASFSLFTLTALGLGIAFFVQYYDTITMNAFEFWLRQKAIWPLLMLMTIFLVSGIVHLIAEQCTITPNPHTDRTTAFNEEREVLKAFLAKLFYWHLSAKKRAFYDNYIAVGGKFRKPAFVVATIVGIIPMGVLVAVGVPKQLMSEWWFILLTVFAFFSCLIVWGIVHAISQMDMKRKMQNALKLSDNTNRVSDEYIQAAIETRAVADFPIPNASNPFGEDHQENRSLIKIFKEFANRKMEKSAKPDIISKFLQWLDGAPLNASDIKDAICHVINLSGSKSEPPVKSDVLCDLLSVEVRSPMRTYVSHKYLGKVKFSGDTMKKHKWKDAKKNFADKAYRELSEARSPLR